MKRRLLIVAVFLLAGAVVNVGVSWGCVTCARNHQPRPWQYDAAGDMHWHKPHTHWHPGPPPNLPNKPSNEISQWWAAHAPAGAYSAVPITAATSSRVGVTTVEAWMSDRGGAERLPRLGVSRTQAGWPFRSIESAEWYNENQARVTFSIGDLPLRPIWPGFAVNTLFCAAALWLLAGGPFALRRFVRVRRGLCPACAYPMGGSEVCTECGKPLPKRARVAT